MDVTLPNGTTYILVVDTDSYAGNFERELAGYATGVCDRDRGHGDREAEDAATADPDMVGALMAKSLPVRHDAYGMVTNTIRATPGRLNNGYGFLFAADDPAAAAEASEKARDSARQYNAKQIEMAQGRIDRNDFQPDAPGAWTRQACETTIASALAMVERAGQGMVFPAYESVAMFFAEPLTPREMTFVKERAEAFSKTEDILHKPFKVLDVYQVEATSGSTETRLDG